MRQVSKQIGVSEQTYYRRRKEYGGLRIDQAKRLKKRVPDLVLGQADLEGSGLGKL